MAQAAMAPTSWPRIDPRWNRATQLRAYFDHLPETQQICVLAFAETLCKRYAYDRALENYNKQTPPDEGGES